MTRRLLPALLGLALAVCGCGRPAGPSSPPLSSSSSPSPSAGSLADSLEPRLAAGAISQAEKGNADYAEAFVLLANTGQTPKVVEGALEGMSLTYSNFSKSGEKRPIDDAYVATVLKQLLSPDKVVRHWAIQCAALAQTGEANVRLGQALQVLAERDEEAVARAEAVDALALDDSWPEDQEIVRTFRAAAQDEPVVASLALFHLRERARELGDPDAFLPALTKLLGSSDPGVRGRAARLLVEGATEAEKAVRAAALEPLLTDPHPFVRSQAALALGDLGYLPSAARLLPLLEDHAGSGYELSYKNLLGEESRLPHQASPLGRVDDAALLALQQLSSALPKARFSYGAVDPNDLEDAIDKQAQRAQAWFDANKKALSAPVRPAAGKAVKKL